MPVKAIENNDLLIKALQVLLMRGTRMGFKPFEKKSVNGFYLNNLSGHVVKVFNRQNKKKSISRHKKVCSLKDVYSSYEQSDIIYDYPRRSTIYSFTSIKLAFWFV